MSRFARGTLLVLFLWSATSPSPVKAALALGYQATGNLGMEIAAVSNLAGQLPSLSGTFSISQLPPGAIIQKAIVYSHDWGNSNPLTLSFGSATLVNGSFQSDTTTIITHLFAYQWDVTAFVIGVPNSYNFTIGSGNQIAGAALVVVWQDPLAPMATVTLVDGARQVGEHTPLISDTETASFTGLPAGPTTLSIFTVSDDAVGTGEVIRYNGTVVGGPIDENLGLGASLIQMTTQSKTGTNVVSITSSADHFGWILAASLVTHAIVPEPGTIVLVLLGVPLIWIAARGRLSKPPCAAP